MTVFQNVYSGGFRIDKVPRRVIATAPAVKPSLCANMASEQQV